MKKHRVTVKKRNLFGSRLWWATCTCGAKQGFYEKKPAQDWAGEHGEERTG